MRFRIGLADIAAVVVVLVLVLLPPRAWPVDRVYDGDPVARAREFGALMADLKRSPSSGVVAERLAERLAAAGQTDWGLRTAAVAAMREGRIPDRWRAQLAASGIAAQRFEVAAAHDWARAALASCDSRGSTCGPQERLRVETYANALGAGVASGIDPRKDPKKFGEAVKRAVPTIRIPSPR